MFEFQQGVEFCNFIDAGWYGYQYTWSKKHYHRSGVELIEERLDRFSCNVEWEELFKDSFVNRINIVGCDHCPTVVEINRSKQ